MNLEISNIAETTSKAGSLRAWLNFGISNRSALLSISAFLTFLGLLAIYGSSSVTAAQQYHSEFHYVTKQATVALIGFLLVFAIGHLPVRWIDRAPLPFYLVSLLLAVMVHVPGIGHAAKGASRWIRLGPIGFQPSELLKVATVLVIARNLTRPGSDMVRFRSAVLSNLMLIALPIILLFLQPDFGTAVVIVAVSFSLMFVRGLAPRYVMGAVALVIAGIAGAIAFSPYRLKRFLTFLDPWSQYERGGFQIIQSFLGFQNGGLWGRGIGESRQKLYFLPDAHTDFILSVIGEELGLFGTLLVAGMFCYVFLIGIRIAMTQESEYRKLVCIGLTSLIAVQALMNISVTLGIVPTKGIPLPFVSNGASSLLTFLLIISILSRLSQPERPIGAQGGIY
jgi:cell division protein FtsW